MRAFFALSALLGFPILVGPCNPQPSPTAPPRLAPEECLVDDDCGLLPSQINCCGECEPVPPFDAVPREAIDALLLELETRCAETPIGCVAPVCEPLPPACSAQAICVEHRCEVSTLGCGPLVSSL